MEFNEALDVIKQYITLPDGVQFDGIIVKKLASSNTLDDGRTTNQTHIAVTGEQMNLFPAVMMEGYFEGTFGDADGDMKKYFVVRVPVEIFKKNLTDNGKESLFEEDSKVVNVSVVRSRRKDEGDQLQVSLLNNDDNDFINFRKQWHEGDYYVVLKEKGSLKYAWFGVASATDTTALNQLNSKFVKDKSQTNVDVAVNIVEETVDNEQAFRQWLDKQVKKDGMPYAESTKKQDCSELKNAKSKELIKDIIPCDNLFNVDDAEVINKIRTDLLADKERYDVFNETNHDCLSKALGDYYKFLVQKHKKDKKVDFKSGYSSDKSHNRIIFGAPGTGKSFKLNKDKDDLLGKNSSNFERVTFHPDYSYAQFVGCYKPTMNGEKIEYSFVPGPFARVLVKALRNILSATDANGQIDSSKVEPFLLIIEEINRAKTAAVFGDVFQLLDRKDGVSEYDIQTSEDLRKYLARELEVSEDAVASIRIPDNMFIWATMNSADQGVFPMDTAFKRRWNFEYTPLDKDEDKNEFDIVTENKKTYQWQALRKAINDVLCGDFIRAHEDKLMGAFFVKDQRDPQKNLNMFCDKVLMYLFEDVARTHRPDLFEKNKVECNRLSSVREKFKKEGTDIFVEEVRKRYSEYEKSGNSSGN